MNRFSSLLLVTLMSLSTASLQAAEPAPGLKGCEAKRDAIEQEIQYAKDRGLLFKVAGLEKALKENQAHCTEAGLRQSREAEVRKAQAEIQEREADLAAAQAKGDAKKIEKRRQKLDEARAELEAAKRQLDQ